MELAATSSNCNLAASLTALAAQLPQRPAVIFPEGRDRQGRVSYTHLTFAQLARETDRFAAGFQRLGIGPGMRVLLMVRPSLEFLPLTFALFKIGAVPVLIDPGMGRKNLLHCIAQVRPEAFVGIPLAHLARLIFRRHFAGIRIFVTIGRRWGWGGYDLDDLRAGDEVPEPVATGPEDLAAIIFTTGSTGPPKGVQYTHGMFVAQRDLLEQVFRIGPGDVDMPGFALFALFSLPLGATVVIPDMDPTRPAEVDPRRIVEAVENFGVTFSFGSPALWRQVARYCLAEGIRLPSLTRVIMAGAPIPALLHEQLLGRILAPEADIFTPYGATECLPVTSFRGSQVLRETAELTRQGHGFCVGEPVPGVRIKIIRTSDAPLARWAEVEELPTGHIGEIVVQGAVVSRRYHELPEQTARHKIYETDDPEHGPFWHRIGDVGYLDAAGRLWFCGRKTHRVETGTQTLYTVCCEAIFNEHPRVRRSALVGLGTDRYRQRPAIIIEPEPGYLPANSEQAAAFRQDLLHLAGENRLTAAVNEVYFRDTFPVDIRHNAKIFREQLAVWAANQSKTG